MKKNLLVAIADKNFVDQAKQLFSSVYWNAGWKGDYMLLTSDMPESELAWFRDKGILVKRCEPVHRGRASGIEYPPTDPSWSDKEIFYMDRFKEATVILNKFNLFTPEFKEWDTVLFLDCDVIVRYSLDRLTEVRGFWAATECKANIRYRKHILRAEFHRTSNDDAIFNELNEKFNLKAKAFNSGVMAFSTDIIRDDSFDTLVRLFHRFYMNAHCHSDQPILNLYFFKVWKQLDYSYNLIVPVWTRWYCFKEKHIDAPILHIFGKNKPWLPDSPFYREWKKNLDRADLIDLTSRPAAPKKFSILKKALLSPQLNNILSKFCPTALYRSLDMRIGLAGIFLKKRSPRLYTALKKRMKTDKNDES